MPTLDEVTQISDEVSYPDGFNQITIEGTGDEGGLSTSRYPSITIRSNPGLLFLHPAMRPRFLFRRRVR